MLNNDCTTKLLNLEDVIITDVKNESEAVHVYLEMPRQKHICPCCGGDTDRVHDYRMQVIKDTPLGRTTFLHLRKRRYSCTCGKRFYERVPFLPRYYRMTSRLISNIIFAFKELTSVTSIGRQYNISNATAWRYFRCVNHTVNELPEVLSLDEFKGNSGGEKYNSIIADPQNRKIIDILPDRYENHLIQYFKQFPSRYKVKFFVCDMNPHFRAVGRVCFPNATIIADRYHVIRQVYWAMENVRKTEQKNLSTRFRKYFKHSKTLLMKPMEKLNDDECAQLALMFEIAPRLADAYRVKNEFLAAIRSKSSAEGKARLAAWLMSAEVMDLPEFQACTRAYHNWFPEILNAMDYKWSNGYIEGCNNKIKVLKRVCFGMRNFRNFRNRILFCQK